MLDFNDFTNASARDDVDKAVVSAELIARLESVLFALFPAGKVHRGKFFIGDVLGSPGRSLEVVLDGVKAGLWTDRATGEGGDVFDLIAAHHGLDATRDFARVLRLAQDLLGYAPAMPTRARRQAPPEDDLGPATAKWDYLDAEGRLIAVVYRYDPPGRRKEFRPWDARRRKMAPPEPRPLYNQPGMKDAQEVVLVEGEKCAQALIEIDIVATTAMHGANAPVDKTDWTPLCGKSVLIWPDRDKPGWAYAMAAAQAALAAGASTSARAAGSHSNWPTAASNARGCTGAPRGWRDCPSSRRTTAHGSHTATTKAPRVTEGDWLAGNSATHARARESRLTARRPPSVTGYR